MTNLADWCFGYCAARGYERPVPALNGRSLWFAVGKPDEQGRYVLVDQGLEVLPQITGANIYVEIAAPRFVLAPGIPQGWRLRTPAYLMTYGGVPPRSISAPPAGFRVERRDHGRSAEVLVRTADDELAARGVVGLDGQIAVFDQIVTEPHFRRQGLGSVVVSELFVAAEAAGATVYLLIATEDGRALYTRLGFQVRTDVVSIISPPS